MTTITDDYELQQTLNSLGGVCNDYMAGTVAWNDGTRGLELNGDISCWGSNVTDARIVSEDNRHMSYIKPKNKNEKIGVTTLKNINFFCKDGNSITGQKLFENINEHTKYAGFKNIMPNIEDDQKIVVRLQSTFIPLGYGQKSRKVVPAHYSYQTNSSEDPCNVIITGTSQGIFVNCDDTGINKLYAHTVEKDGTVNNHWFEACPTKHSVGGVQIENESDANDKKTKAKNLGFANMGNRCNTFLVISFQRKQNKDNCNSYIPSPPVYRSLCKDNYNTFGISSAARMSIDECIVGTKELYEIDAVRVANTPIVLTILNYYVIESKKEGQQKVSIEPTDVAMAVGDMENIYKMCDMTGTLSQLPIMLKNIDSETMEGIKHKLNNDPPVKQDPYMFCYK